MDTRNNESTPMKTTLNFLLLALAIAVPATAFAGLVGILPPAAFVGAEAALFAFTFVGLMTIVLNDGGKARRPVTVHDSIPAICPSLTARAATRRPSYGLRRRERVVAA